MIPDDVKGITANVQKFLDAIKEISGLSDNFCDALTEATNGAGQLIILAKQLPRTGKFSRNIFIKTYNRRPGNKQKRAGIMAQIATSSALCASRIAMINSQARRIPGAKILAACPPEICHL